MNPLTTEQSSRPGHTAFVGDYLPRHCGRWLEEEGSEDSHARALWAVGTVLGRSRNEGYGRLCGLLFKRGLPVVQTFTSPRAWAFALLAIHEYLRRFNGDRLANATRDKLTEKLLTLWHSSASEDWPWFEPVATYGNARLSMPHAEAREIGLKSLRWLCNIQTAPAGHFRPIGSNGFNVRGGHRSEFDQQPIQAHATLSACLEAYRATKDSAWSGEAQRAFGWFLGRNDLGLPLYDSATGGWRRGPPPQRPHEKQGAESSLAFYLAHAEMTLAQNLMEAQTLIVT